MNRTRKAVIQEGQPHERRHPLESGGVQISTFVPLRFKKRGNRKVVVAPAGVQQAVTVETPTQAIPASVDATLLKTIARGFYWQHLLDIGVAADAIEIAEREGLHRVTVNDGLRFALLAPNIVERALEGVLPRTITLETLQRCKLPLDWEIQWRAIGG